MTILIESCSLCAAGVLFIVLECSVSMCTCRVHQIANKYDYFSNDNLTILVLLLNIYISIFHYRYIGLLLTYFQVLCIFHRLCPCALFKTKCYKVYIFLIFCFSIFCSLSSDNKPKPSENNIMYPLCWRILCVDCNSLAEGPLRDW